MAYTCTCTYFFMRYFGMVMLERRRCMRTLEYILEYILKGALFVCTHFTMGVLKPIHYICTAF